MITALEPVEETENAQCFETLALHAGTIPDPTTGAILTPIYQTTTYRQWAVGKDKGFKCMKTYGHLRQDHSFAQAQRVSFGVAA
jgi:cystathionine beta-lyase/cystathionine gamma-synthase